MTTKVHTRYKNSEGKVVPSVTTILGVLGKPALIHWAWKLGLEGEDYKKFRDKTAEAGTLAHAICAQTYGGPEPDYKKYSQEIISLAENAVIKFYDWNDEHSINPILIEEPLISEEHQFGGTIDFYGEFDGRLALIDFKTSKALYEEHYHQLAAYYQLLKENGNQVDIVRVLRIGRTEDEGFEDHQITEAQLTLHWELFTHCKEIYRLQKELKK